ncbi:MAG: glycosyltransferase family 39 protein [Chloroflexi bacterium]|nr:glycosyltransferase family 39 protein [Chloroflexota bacterium]
MNPNERQFTPYVLRFTQHATRHARFAPSLVTYATLLVAFFLRVYRLAENNVWWDEGWSIWLSQKDLAWIALRTAADEHPPLHYWLLHFWNAVAGTEVFAGRFLSVAFGVLTVALIFRIGKRVGGGWIGVLAALFLALARFHIWWSQDIKNYTPSIFFAFAALWFALDLIARRASTRTVFVLVRAFHVSRFTFYSITRRWLAANILGALLFAPWLYLYLTNAAAWSAAPPFDFGTFLKLVATVLPLGVTTNIENYYVVTLVLTALVMLPVISILYSVFRNKRLKTEYCLLFTLIVLLPPALLYALSLTPVAFFAPKIQGRYLLVLLPAYTILLALGVATLKRLSTYVALAATIFVVGASAFMLNDYYATRRLRDDYASLANTINAFARADDLVLLNTDQEWPTFLYYLRSPLDWLGAPNGAPMNAANADSLVRRALARHDAVWLVAIPDALATDPQRLVETRLARELNQQYERTVGDKRLVLYAPAPRDFVNVPRENLAAQFPRSDQLNDILRLVGYDLPTRTINAGDTFRVATYWRATYPAQISVRLNGLVTTTLNIPSGDLMRFENDFAIPPDASGEFDLQLGPIALARVRVEPNANPELSGPISHPVDYRLGEAIHLIGYDLPRAKLRAGESVSVTLYWSTDRRVQKNYVAFVHLLGTQFNPAQNNPLWGQIDRSPSTPTSAWLPDGIVADIYRVPIDAHAPPGKYKLEIGLYDPATGARLAVGDGPDSILLDEIEIAP